MTAIPPQFPVSKINILIYVKTGLPVIVLAATREFRKKHFLKKKKKIFGAGGNKRTQRLIYF